MYEAKAKFSELLNRAEGGESITIARAGRPVAQLVPMTRASQPRVPGALRGQIHGAESLLDRDVEVEELFNGARE